MGRTMRVIPAFADAAALTSIAYEWTFLSEFVNATELEPDQSSVLPCPQLLID